MAPVVCDQDQYEERGRDMGRGTSRTRRLTVTLGVNVALAAGQVVAGLVAHSTGLLADAGHNITDVAGIAMSLAAVRFALRPRSPAHSFGYHRGTILAALALELDDVVSEHRRLWTTTCRPGGLEDSVAWFDHLRSCYLTGEADKTWFGPST